MIDKQLRKYIVPNMLAMMGISCFILADTFFISVAEGANGITALNLTLPVYSLVFAIGDMIGVGAATRYSLYKASGRPEADEFFSNAVIWNVLISMVFVLVAIFFPDHVLRLMGADEEILEVGRKYLSIAISFSPFFMMNYTFTAFVRNDGAPKLAMTATILSSIFNIIFDYVFMFPLKMGMPGAALASGISPGLSMLICMIHYLSSKNTIVFRLQMPSVKRLFQSCVLGFVAFVGEMASGITTMVFNFILLSLEGNIAVAAYGIIANISIVGTSLFNGISQGLQPLASVAHGKGEKEKGSKIYRQSLGTGVCLAICMTVVIWIWTKSFVAVFNSEHSVKMAEYAEYGMRLYFAGYVFASVNTIKAGYLSATGRGGASSAIAILRGVIAIVGFAFLLSKLFGITGVWIAFPVAELFTMIVSGLLVKR